MLANFTDAQNDQTETITAILGYCSDDNAVLRSAAIRAMAMQAGDDKRPRDTLLAALMDEDPDVRTDAMDALIAHVTPEDAPILQRSLEGDPVREVKLAAIRTLGQLKDTSSIPLLRDLMLSRCDETVAWEDELGDWEDWLDIQIAAIHALGDIGATEVIDDMFNALNDEFGQSLDIPVFSAFAKMGSAGVPWLLAQIELGQNLSRKRAADALVLADPQAIRDYSDVILKSSVPALKRLLISVLPDGDPQIAALFEDSAIEVRCAVLDRLGPTHLEYQIKGLSDPSEAVKTMALKTISLPLDMELQDAIASNALVWLQTGGAELASAAADILVRIAPEKSQEPLLEVARDEERPLDLRVAAVRALGGMAAEDALAALLSNPAQQVRLAAVHGLKTCADRGSEQAMTILAETIKGTVLTPEDRVQRREGEAGSDISTPKGEGAGPIGRRVRISRDGDIITENSDQTELPSTPTSTLDALQMVAIPEDDEEEQLAEDTPEESSAKRRKRRAVEGPEAVGDDLSLAALTIAAQLNDTQIDVAVQSRLIDTNDALRAAAWSQMAQRDAGMDVSSDVIDTAKRMLQDSNPSIRLAAYQTLHAHASQETLLQDPLQDNDPLVRAHGVALLNAGTALSFVTDPAHAVREAALEQVLTVGEDHHAAACVDQLLTSDQIDTMSRAIKRSAIARDRAAALLAEDGSSPRSALVLLEAFAKGEEGVA